MNPFLNGFGARLAAAALVVGCALFGPVQAAEVDLALRGYDPVAYFTESRAAVGEERFRFEWDGATYQFSSARNLELFKADPDRYLPQYGNLCTVSLAMGRKVAGDPLYWLVKDGRLYLFSGPATRDEMSRNPADITAAAGRNWGQMSRPSAPAQ